MMAGEGRPRSGWQMKVSTWPPLVAISTSFSIMAAPVPGFARPLRAAACNEIRIEETRLAIAQGLAVERHRAAARRPEDRLAGGGIPFHGVAEARVIIRLARGEQAEFDGAAGDAPLGTGQRREICRKPRLVDMRAAMHDDGAARRCGTRRDRLGCGAAALAARGAGAGCGIEHALHRRIDHAQRRLALFDEADIDAELAVPRDELPGAVEGIDQPE